MRMRISYVQMQYLVGGAVMNSIITISRQFGSGGRLIGKTLAQQLGIPFYDKEIIAAAAEKSGFAKEFIQENEQKIKGISSFAFTSSFWGGNLWSNIESFESRIYAFEADAIEQFANNGPCVIVGRCADYVLRDKFSCMNVFIHSGIEHRLDRIINVYKLANDSKKAEKLIKENDKARAKHYRYYTDSQWGSSDNYHISIDSGLFGIDKSVEILKSAYEHFDD